MNRGGAPVEHAREVARCARHVRDGITADRPGGVNAASVQPIKGAVPGSHLPVAGRAPNPADLVEPRIYTFTGAEPGDLAYSIERPPDEIQPVVLTTQRGT